MLCRVNHKITRVKPELPDALFNPIYPEPARQHRGTAKGSHSRGWPSQSAITPATPVHHGPRMSSEKTK